MDAIEKLFNIDYVSVILAIFIIMSAFIAIHSIIGKFSVIVGKPFKWVYSKDADHKLLMDHEKKIANLAAKHKEDTDKINRDENAIRQDIAKLTNMFLDKQIDDMRYEILDFASSLSSGRKHNRESFDHILRVYNKYEKILEENNWENGLVEESVKYIQETYHDLLKSGGLK